MEIWILITALSTGPSTSAPPATSSYAECRAAWETSVRPTFDPARFMVRGWCLQYWIEQSPDRPNYQSLLAIMPLEPNQ